MSSLRVLELGLQRPTAASHAGGRQNAQRDYDLVARLRVAGERNRYLAVFVGAGDHIAISEGGNHQAFVAADVDVKLESRALNRVTAKLFGDFYIAIQPDWRLELPARIERVGVHGHGSVRGNLTMRGVTRDRGPSIERNRGNGLQPVDDGSVGIGSRLVLGVGK